MSDEELSPEEEEMIREAEAEQAEQDAAIEAEAKIRAASAPQDHEAAATELRDKLLRALAEVENTRRRAERDKDDAYKYAITRFARDVLSVADNLRRALDSVDEDARNEGGEALSALIAGVSMTERELLNTFEKHGIKQVNPGAGERFDPNLHQAVAEIPGTGQPNGAIVQVAQTGFVIEDRLLRPAMVLVAKGEAAAAPTPPDPQAEDDGLEDGPEPGSKIDTQA